MGALPIYALQMSSKASRSPFATCYSFLITPRRPALAGLAGFWFPRTRMIQSHQGAWAELSGHSNALLN